MAEQKMKDMTDEPKEKTEKAEDKVENKDDKEEIGDGCCKISIWPSQLFYNHFTGFC